LTPPPASYIPSGPSNSAMFLQPLLHPDPIHVPPRNNNIANSISTAATTARVDPAPSDEGRMSISIDFGEYPLCYW
jgi:hypothetical protein